MEFIVYWVTIGLISAFFLHLTFPCNNRRFSLSDIIFSTVVGVVAGPVITCMLLASICTKIAFEIFDKFEINFNKTIINLDKPSFKEHVERQFGNIDGHFDLIGAAIERIDENLTKLNKKSKRK